MASTVGVSATLYDALAKRKDCIWALRAAHFRSHLSRTKIAMGIIEPGLIGATLLACYGITSSKIMLLSDICPLLHVTSGVRRFSSVEGRAAFLLDGERLVRLVLFDGV